MEFYIALVLLQSLINAPIYLPPLFMVELSALMPLMDFFGDDLSNRQIFLVKFRFITISMVAVMIADQ